MKIVLLCVVALVMLVQLPSEGDAVCCYGKGLAWNVRCKDCSKGTPFCAKGKSCNIFGCNCMGGCRDGPCPSTHNHHVHEKPMYEAPVGRDYESSYDSAPTYGHETEMSASNDYDIPAPVSETEMSSSNDYDIPETEYSSSSESETSPPSDKDTPPIDCTYGCYGDETPEITTADDVISSADEDGDGNMDIDEAERFLVKRGLATSGYRAKRSLRAIDLNNDNFISAEEIELYE